MRILLAILIAAALMFGATSAATAQTHLPVPVASYLPWQPFWQSPKLQIRPYAAISTGFIVANGAGMSYLYAPVGLMLIRPINNNFAAYGTISVAPTILGWNSIYHDPALRSSGYNLGLTSRIEGGLIYTNDARTFSISGGVSVERGGYPMNPALSHPSSYTPKSY